MLIGFWSPKGGSGVSTVAAACALAARRSMPTIVVDPWGDLTALFAVPPPAVGWNDLVAAAELPSDALDRIAVEVDERLRLVAPGGSGHEVERRRTGAGSQVGVDLQAALRRARSTVIVDLGLGEGASASALATTADALVCVIRPCYLALRRALAHPLLAPSNGVFVVEEPGRALTANDVASTLQRRELGAVSLRPAIARSIDAGTFVLRPSEGIVRAADTMLRRLGCPAEGLRSVAS